MLSKKRKIALLEELCAPDVVLLALATQKKVAAARFKLKQMEALLEEVPKPGADGRWV